MSERRATRKGDMGVSGVKVVLEVVLAVIVIYGMFNVLGVANGLVDYIKNLLGSSSAIYDQENLLAAIQCSYERCTEGCDEVGSINIAEGSQATLNCQTDFCTPFADSGDNGGHVCGQLARDHPVYVKTTEALPLSTADLAGMVDCPDVEEKCAVAAIAPDYTPGYHTGKYMNFQSSLIEQTLESSGSCKMGDYCAKTQCKQGEAPSASCCAKSFRLNPKPYYIWTETTQISPVCLSPYNIGIGLNQYTDWTATYAWGTTDSMSCSQLDPATQPCVRFKPVDAALVDDATHNIYKLSFYVQGDSNILQGSGDDKQLNIFAAIGRSWNGINQPGFKAADFAGVDISLVDRGCGKLDGSCAATPVTASGSYNRAGLLFYDGTHLVPSSPDASKTYWGAETTVCDASHPIMPSMLNPSIYGSKDIIITFKFKKGGSFDVSQWDTFGTSGIAFYIGGAATSGGANVYWSPAPSASSDQYATFTAKTQTLNVYGNPSKGNDGKPDTDGYCNPGVQPLGSLDGLTALSAGADSGFPPVGIFQSSVENWQSSCGFPTTNCRLCGKGCPNGLCDNVAGSCSLAWAGAVGIMPQPKFFACCNNPSTQTTDWQEGLTCPVTQAKVDETACSTPCSAKCTSVGYGNPTVNSCTEPGTANNPYCHICECVQPVSTSSGGSGSGPTTSTTTTTTLPPCGYSDCQIELSSACRCGTQNCPAGQFCCPTAGACGTQTTCGTACGGLV
ncbi:MAG: hypothetical protein NT016_02915 [Candidatus Aenigmarchaeota archaeon]|nr:hypothetical protein [Candidatus Aenigmarchaeota archaeon]